MNFLDLVILLTLAWFAIAGATARLPRELVTLLAMLLGVVLAGLFHERLADDLLVLIDSFRAARVVGFCAIFFAVWGAGQIVVVLYKDQVQTITFGRLDFGGGLAVGLLKGVILIETMLFLFARYQFDATTDAIDGSLLAPIFLRGIPFVLWLLPSAFRSAVDAFPGTP
jgi:membrane protein required for colicin V production